MSRAQCHAFNTLRVDDTKEEDTLHRDEDNGAFEPDAAIQMPLECEVPKELEQFQTIDWNLKCTNHDIYRGRHGPGSLKLSTMASKSRIRNAVHRQRPQISRKTAHGRADHGQGQAGCCMMILC